MRKPAYPVSDFILEIDGITCEELP